MQLQLNDWLTFSRIIMTPLILGLLYSNKIKTGLIFFLIACLTDWLDGYYARKLKTESDFGRILDPMADKWLTLALLIFLLHTHQIKSFFTLIVYVLLFRELMVVTLRMYSPALTASGSSTAGKMKTILLDISIFALILNMICSYKIIYFIGVYGLVFSAILAIFSCIKYSISFYRLLNKQ